MDEVVQALRAHHEGGHDLPAVSLLSGSGDHAGLDEVHDGDREHLGVDAEVALVAERHGHGRRDRPDAQLESGPVRDEVRDVLADPPLDVADPPVRCSYGGTSTSTARSMSSTWMKLSPRVRGIDRLNWTMTIFAARIAACIASTDVPSEQNPWRSGGGRVDEDRIERKRPRVESRGTSDRKTGT